MNVRIGLIGAGNWGRNLARTLYELGVLAIIAEPRPEIQNELKDLYPNVLICSDHNELLRSELPAVVIATPAATHYEVAKASLEAGKHTFVEKPLSLSLSQAEELVRLAKEKNLVLMVGHLLLFQPAIQWIRDFLKTGELGRVFSLHQERLKLGTVREVENVLWSFGVHDIAALLFLTGEKPNRVAAWGQAAIQERIEDDVYLHLRFPSGVDAHLHTSWLWPEKRRRLTVVGERGMLVYDENKGEVTLHHRFVLENLKHVDEGSEVVFKSSDKPLRLELLHFIECFTNGKTPISDGESALPVIWVLEKASEQLRGQKTKTFTNAES